MSKSFVFLISRDLSTLQCILFKQSSLQGSFFLGTCIDIQTNIMSRHNVFYVEACYVITRWEVRTWYKDQPIRFWGGVWYVKSRDSRLVCPSIYPSPFKCRELKKILSRHLPYHQPTDFGYLS